MISRRNLNIWLAILVCFVVSANPATAATIYVPSGHPSIQDAINAAVSGVDEIEVAPGTYYEGINFLGKAIRLYSTGGPDATIIDGQGAYHVVQCVSGEQQDTVLEGFTITGGNANGASPHNSGGGMYCYSSSPTVNNCIFSGNTADSGGGGMHSWNWSTPTVTNCTFSDNQAGYRGAGLSIYWYCAATISGCTFSGNAVTGGNFCNGGGLAVSFDLGTIVT
ncbi:MAG: right-handed parallel beta-helix repeat-containing protein, partial [Planctomycetota bacterium]